MSGPYGFGKSSVFEGSSGSGLPGDGEVLYFDTDDNKAHGSPNFLFDAILKHLYVGTESSGLSVDIESTLGSELAPALTAGSWTCTGGWAISGGKLVLTAGTGSGTATPNPNISITAGVTYKVVFTVDAVSGSYTTFDLGGTQTKITSGDTPVGTHTRYITALSTATAKFSNSTSGEAATISALSIKALTASTGDLDVKGALTVRSASYFKNPVGMNMLGTRLPNSPLEVEETGTNEAIRVSRLGSPTQYISINERGGANHAIDAYGAKHFLITNADGYNIVFRPTGSTGADVLTLSNAAITATLPYRAPDGTAAAPAYSFSGDTTQGIYRVSSQFFGMTDGGSGSGAFIGSGGTLNVGRPGSFWTFYANAAAPGGNIGLNAAAPLGWSSGDADGTLDTILRRDDANILAQRNSTTAQAFRIYNTYTDGSNYERGALYWSGNALYLNTEAAGTGTGRSLYLDSAARLYLRAGGANEVYVTTNGTIRWYFSSTGHIIANADNSYDIGGSSNRVRGLWAGNAHLGTGTTDITTSGAGLFIETFNVSGDGSPYSARAIVLKNTSSTTANGAIQWWDKDNNLEMALGKNYHIAGSLLEISDGSGPRFNITGDVTQIRNSTSAQTFQIYNTYTDGSNYERGFARWLSNVFEVGTEKAGTGSSRQTRIRSSDTLGFMVGAPSSDVWLINYANDTAGGILYPLIDNVRDIGGVSNRVRNFYWGTQAYAPDGTAAAPAYSFANDTDTGFYMPAAGAVDLSIAGTATHRFNSGYTQLGSGGEIFVLRAEAANVMAQRNTTNAQTFRIYNTYTDAANNEYGWLGWSGNQFLLRSAKSGTGSNREIGIYAANAGAALLFNENSYCYPSSNNTMYLGSASYYFKRLYTSEVYAADGTAGAPSITFGSDTDTGMYRGTANAIDFACSGAIQARLSTNSFEVIAAARIGFSDDLELRRDAADTLAQRRTTNAQTFRIYNTYTDASNYERGTINWTSNLFILGTEKAGTGSSRSLSLEPATGINYSKGHFYPKTDASYYLGLGILKWLAVFTGGFTGGTISKSANYTVDAGDHVILVSAAAANRTITLPAAADNAGRIIHIKKTDSSTNYVRIDGNASELVEDATTQDLLAQGENLMLQCDGTQWWVI